MTEYPSQHAVHDSPSNGGGAGAGGDANVKEKAAASAQAGKQAASEVAQTAADKAKDVASEASSQARNVLNEAQGQLQEHARDQHRNAVTNLRSLGDELNAMADRSDQHGLAGDLVSQAGARVGSVASWLDGREPGDLVEELRAFARRRPGTFLLGALAAGVVAGRLTRGVVAVHQDDDSTAATQPAAAPLPQAAPTAPSATTAAMPATTPGPAPAQVAP